jgi:hypothetical protein
VRNRVTVRDAGDRLEQRRLLLRLRRSPPSHALVSPCLTTTSTTSTATAPSQDGTRRRRSLSLSLCGPATSCRLLRARRINSTDRAGAAIRSALVVQCTSRTHSLGSQGTIANIVSLVGSFFCLFAARAVGGAIAARRIHNPRRLPKSETDSLAESGLVRRTPTFAQQSNGRSGDAAVCRGVKATSSLAGSNK